jgi:uncharacterized protein (DUF2252 family)
MLGSRPKFLVEFIRSFWMKGWADQPWRHNHRTARTRSRNKQVELSQTRNLKMARSAHAYVRGSTVKFYEWLEDSAGKVPSGPPIWICGDCHVGNLGPLADAKAAPRYKIVISIKP